MLINTYIVKSQAVKGTALSLRANHSGKHNLNITILSYYLVNFVSSAQLSNNNKLITLSFLFQPRTWRPLMCRKCLV